MKKLLKFLFVLAAVAFLVPVVQQSDAVTGVLAVALAVPIVGNLVLPYVQTNILGMNSLEARMVFENSKQAMVKAFGPDVLNKVILTQGSLRFEQPLVAGQTLYTFPILDNQQLFSNMEDRLKLQDSFVISSIFVGTAAPSSATDNTFQVDTYPNFVKYGAANAAALNAFWNAGNLQLTVNNRIVTPKWDLQRHYNTNETQQTAALGAGSPNDQTRGAFDGWYPVEPNVVMIGQKDTQLQIILKGAGLTAVLANSRAVIMVRGVLAQNSTVVS